MRRRNFEKYVSHNPLSRMKPTKTGKEGRKEGGRRKNRSVGKRRAKYAKKQRLPTVFPPFQKINEGRGDRKNERERVFVVLYRLPLRKGLRIFINCRNPTGGAQKRNALDLFVFQMKQDRKFACYLFFPVILRDLRATRYIFFPVMVLGTCNGWLSLSST